ncbi:UbiA family prenyltransferase [Cellulomonas sp. SLBN-39]|uniref:UbiA family prenyltransferase n=1 Tax=Cellulomonas sp. SLBN-39 TaxID=2768446 RepID=UPI0011512BD3
MPRSSTSPPRRRPASGGRARAATAAALARACHLGPTVVVTALSTALAVGLGAAAPTVLLVLLVVLTGQLSIGWSNDWVDAARDRAAGRTDKPVVQGAVTAATLRAAAVGALVVSVAASALAGPAAAVAHLGVVAMGWAYNLRLKATAASWVPYALAFALLPGFVVLALPGPALPAAWLLAVGALLGVGAHLANVLPDLEDDAATGVRGLPHRLGRRATGVLAPAVLALAVLVAVLGPPGPPAPPGAVVGVAAVLTAVAAGVVGLRRERSRLPFTLAMVVALLCVAALVLSGTRGATT